MKLVINNPVPYRIWDKVYQVVLKKTMLDDRHIVTETMFSNSVGTNIRELARLHL